MWSQNVGTAFFRFVTNHAFDRRTDGQTDGQTDRQTQSFLVARPRCMQRGKTQVKGNLLGGGNCYDDDDDDDSDWMGL